MTTNKFLAVSVKGQEFLFDKSRTIAVPDTSAQKICDTLNNMKYKLKNDDETWFIHDNDFYFNMCIMYEIKRYSNKGMKLYNYTGF